MREGDNEFSEAQYRLFKPFVRWFSAWHTWLYRCSGGHMFNRLGGGEVCLVTTTGAKSGRPREFPLMYIPWRDGIVLVASQGGAPKHPAWYYNLIAHPGIEVRVRDEVMRLTARLASAAEKAAVWPVCCEVYPEFETYRQRTARDIPVFICE